MLTRSEIIAKAAQFSDDWKDAKDEDAEAKSFWDALFLVFGTPRKNVARFEVPIKRKDSSTGYIDVLWKGKLLVEHKSKGKSLVDARRQAQEYVLELKPADRPQWLVVCDFDRFEVIEQATGAEQHFQLADLSRNIDALGFIAGFQPRKPSVSAPVNIKAVELLGEVYDTLKAGGYPQHELPPLLVRLLFALFAEDTAIFEPEQFRSLILDHSKEDGSDLGSLLDMFFEVLNTDPAKRQKLLPAHLAAFPYVNGALFNHRLPNAAMDKAMRDALLKATEFDWTQISPAIFGSLFQSVMEGAERRALGAHYTSEDDILKLIKPLFLDELDAELASILRDANRRDAKLDLFHDKIAKLKLLDPACGCGNFLIVAYRELRRLETRLLVERYKATASSFLDIDLFVLLNVDAMYGIELEEFPAEIARVGMWLMDHICNTELAAAFGKSFSRLPLKKTATIVCANALTTDWASVLPADECSYVIGNPPFIGAKFMTNEQRTELERVTGALQGSGVLDYVCAWYFKAAGYVGQRPTRCAFVSTNSITQGEQVGVMWPALFRAGMKIHFAHRTFAWKSEARGMAHVHVVIVGFGYGDQPNKRIFDHSNVGIVREIAASNISPYLVDASDTVVTSRSQALCGVPAIGIGNKPIDGGFYIFTEEEKTDFLKKEPLAAALMRRYVGAQEFLNGNDRWILFLANTTPSEIKALPFVRERVEKVRSFRAGRKSGPTVAIASTPTKYHVQYVPTGTYLAVPKVSSQRRTYIPIGFMDQATLVSDLMFATQAATVYEFGILSSLMHNAWMRTVAGRLKSDYRYSAGIVYNNFIWPENATDAQKAKVKDAAQHVLDVRAKYPTETLSNLYDPALMPADLVKAHEALDRAVDACYRKPPFVSEMERVQFLFKLYEAKVAPLALATKGRRKRP